MDSAAVVGSERTGLSKQRAKKEGINMGMIREGGRGESANFEECFDCEKGCCWVRMTWVVLSCCAMISTRQEKFKTERND